MRLLLKIAQDDGYENIVPFVYESKEKAIADLQATYNASNNAYMEFRLRYSHVCRRRDELNNEIRRYGFGEIPQKLMDELRVEMQKTDLRNFQQPSEKVDFAGLDLTLDSFRTNHDGHINESMPEILTIDEFFAEVE